MVLFHKVRYLDHPFSRSTCFLWQQGGDISKISPPNSEKNEFILSKSVSGIDKITLVPEGRSLYIGKIWPILPRHDAEKLVHADPTGTSTEFL